VSELDLSEVVKNVKCKGVDCELECENVESNATVCCLSPETPTND